MPRLYLNTVKQPTRDDLTRIIVAARNPKRPGGVQNIGPARAFAIFEKRARAQAEHDHYWSHEAAARRLRFHKFGWPLVSEAEQIRREDTRKRKSSRKHS